MIYKLLDLCDSKINSKRVALLGLTYKLNIYEVRNAFSLMTKATQNVDLLVILSGWNEFRAFDLKRLAQKMARHRVSGPLDAENCGVKRLPLKAIVGLQRIRNKQEHLCGLRKREE